MSQTPIPTTSSSPQKRPNDDSQVLNDAKRMKVGGSLGFDESSFNLDDFDTTGLGLPTNNSTISSPMVPLQIPAGSSQPNSSLSTPSQIQLELPPLQQNSSALQMPMSNSATPTSMAIPEINQPIQAQQQKEAPQKKTDTGELADAVATAGVDLKAEEALLNSTINNLPSKPGLPANDQSINQPIILNTPFLDPRQLAAFMNKVVYNNGLRQSLEHDSGILELVTYACEEWLTDIVSSSVIISRHRRRSIKNRKRSEISKALRDISVQQKNLEDKRAEKKKNFGISNDDKEKEGTDETLHKATNATVAFLTGKKKKYSWMTGGGTGVASSRNSAGPGVSENGIRFREAREEPGIAVRDLLSTLEKKRMGVDKTITKGYAKLKD